MTVGELKKALEGVSEDMLVSVENQGDEAVANVARLNPPSKFHAGVWDSENKVHIQETTFWIGAA